MTTGTTYSQNPGVSDDSFNLDVGKITRIVKTVTTDPENGWPSVQHEYGSTKGLYLNFIIPLSIFAALCGLINSSILGMSLPGGGTFKTPLAAAATVEVMKMAVQLVMMFVGAMVLCKLAPTFSGSTNTLRALRLLAFSYGLNWIASVATIVPFIGWLVALVAALYGIYVFYKGVPTMTGVPKDKSLVYTIVSIVVMFVINLVAGAVVAIAGGAAMMGGAVMSGMPTS